MGQWNCFSTCSTRKEPVRVDRGDVITRRIIIVLESNVSRRLSSGEISDHICMNYNYISGVFKENRA